MLNVKISNEMCTTDIEELFLKINLTGTLEERKVIELIEQGKYNDKISYIDRFGFKLHLSEMSNGCKAALCILHNPNKEINIAECGLNARDIILTTFHDGNVIIEDKDVTINDYSNNGVIDLCLDGYKFTEVNRLNFYLFNERPYAPDLSIGGITLV